MYNHIPSQRVYNIVVTATVEQKAATIYIYTDTMDDNLAIALVSVKPENRCEKNNDKACPCIIFIYIYFKKRVGSRTSGHVTNCIADDRF